MLTDQEIAEAKRALKELADEAQGNGNSEKWIAAQERPILAVIAAHEAKDEPFGYFRAGPFGWTDCAATDEGAIALYERPAAPAVPQGETVAWCLGNPMYADSSNVFLAHEFTPDEEHKDEWTALYSATPSQEPAAPIGLPQGITTSQDDGKWRVTLAFDSRLDAEALRAYMDANGVPTVNFVSQPSQEPVTLTEREIGDCIDKTNRESQYGHHHFGWSKDLAANIIAALREKEQACK